MRKYLLVLLCFLSVSGYAATMSVTYTNNDNWRRAVTQKVTFNASGYTEFISDTDGLMKPSGNTL